jgi:hypothetical protein
MGQHPGLNLTVRLRPASLEPLRQHLAKSSEAQHQTVMSMGHAMGRRLGLKDRPVLEQPEELGKSRVRMAVVIVGFTSGVRGAVTPVGRLLHWDMLFMEYTSAYPICFPWFPRTKDVESIGATSLRRPSVVKSLLVARCKEAAWYSGNKGPINPIQGVGVGRGRWVGLVRNKANLRSISIEIASWS